RLTAYLPEGSEVQRVRGELTAAPDVPRVDELLRRAMNARADYLAEQKNVVRYEIEEQGARRLRIPEPQIFAGVKRADVTKILPADRARNLTETGLAFTVSVPLPLFNRGQYDVARYQAQQEQIKARMAVLAQQIRAEIQGARDVLVIRRDALADYQRQLE